MHALESHHENSKEESHTYIEKLHDFIYTDIPYDVSCHNIIDSQDHYEIISRRLFFIFICAIFIFAPFFSNVLLNMLVLVTMALEIKDLCKHFYLIKNYALFNSHSNILIVKLLVLVMAFIFFTSFIGLGIYLASSLAIAVSFVIGKYCKAMFKTDNLCLMLDVKNTNKQDMIANMAADICGLAAPVIYSSSKNGKSGDNDGPKQKLIEELTEAFSATIPN